MKFLLRQRRSKKAEIGQRNPAAAIQAAKESAGIPLWCPFPAACGLFTASGNGSGRPWNIAAVVFLTARICRESGLKGVHQKRATGWRTLSPTPAGSGKSARPVPAGRGTLTTGSVYAAPHQPAQ